jgi:uncharacterized RDD family membrane protein YckC
MSARPNVYQAHATARMESLTGLPLAFFRDRFAAYFVDLVLVLLAYIPVMVLIEWLKAGRGADVHIDLKWDFHEASNIIFALPYFGLTLYFGNGQTPGKRLMRIRVVSLVHDRITFWHDRIAETIVVKDAPKLRN